MSERLTDEQLHILAKVGSADVQAMAEELLELRSFTAQGVNESHLVNVARLADALPIDEEVDRKATAALNKAAAGYTKRKLTMPALTDSERAVLARLVTEIRDECELLADFGNRGEALAILDRLTRTEGK